MLVQFRNVNINANLKILQKYITDEAEWCCETLYKLVLKLPTDS